MSNLVSKLKSVDVIPDFVNVDKKQELRKLLDEARREYPVLDRAARGDISFSEVIERAYGKHKGLRLVLPRFKDEEYDRKLDELKLDGLIQADGFRTDSSQVFAKGNSYLGSSLGWFYDKAANPVVAPLLIGGLFAVMSGGQGRFESEIANYSAYFGVGALTGLLAGLIASMMKYQQISISREQARHIDTKINEVYRS